MKNYKLKKRIIEISYRHNLSHLGSCLGAIDTLEMIFSKKKETDKVILSAGHAGLALYTILESHSIGSAEELLETGGIHPDCLTQPVDCSSGSLGHGLGIAIGMALANPDDTIYVVSTDGEMAEGSMWEALEVIARHGITNIRLYVLINGMGAYHFVHRGWLIDRLMKYEDIADIEYDVLGLTKKHHDWITPVSVDVTEDFPILKGLDAHYKVLTKEEYEYLMSLLNYEEN